MTERLNPLQKGIRALGSDWRREQNVRLGDYSENVETGTPGEFYARQTNGRVIRVINAIHTSPRFDKRVRVACSKYLPNKWKIVEELEDYNDPVSEGEIGYHHEQHEEQGPDRVTLDRKQVRQLSVRAAGGWIVKVFGAAVPTASGIVFVDNEFIDLSGETVTEGAVYVSIEADDNGDLSLNPGTPFGAPNIGTASDIPVPDPGKYPIAYVMMYEGQTEIIDNHIRPFLPLPGVGLSGSHTHEIFDDTEGDPADVSTSASSDGTSEFAARRDHVHYLDTTGLGGDGAGHVHGVARWNGASSQTTFDLPDLASYLESVTLNGLEEDPAVFSLSSDGSQIVLDTALASATTVIAHYVLLNL